MRIAVIGLAGVGKKHVQVFSEIAELACVCDLNEEVLNDTSSKFGLKGYADAKEMFEAEQLDAVSLCTPPKSHAPLTEMAAAKGASILAEKPMANSVENCRKMIDVCKDAGVTLMIAQKKRFVPTVARLKELTEGDLGPIKFLLHRYPHPGMSQKDWFWSADDGGGPILENAVHAADTIRFLCGDVERVYAEGSTAFAEHRAPVINCAVYTVRFKSGAIANVGAGMASCPGFSFEDFYAATDKGVAEVSGPFDNADTIRFAFRENPKDVTEEKVEGADPFLLEMQHFIECIEQKKEPLTSGYEGMKAVELCLAVKQSAAEGKPIDLA
ncbi:MAG: Gfo/Idh/MocA family oxidoreductase [Planctomycetes bacterium]|nr:Gfo/Idh/MocA family oxidoreductase [Planctomycetota bacterium]